MGPEREFRLLASVASRPFLEQVRPLTDALSFA